MDFAQTTLGGLMNSVVHEKSKYISLFYKLKSLIAINKGNKLINNSVDKLLFTSLPIDIMSNINYKHPIVTIFIEYLTKMEMCGDGNLYFISLLDKFADEACFLLENGLLPREISSSFSDAAFSIKLDVPPFTENIRQAPVTLSNDSKLFINRIIGEPTIARLLTQAIESTQSFDGEKIRICKIASGTFEDSYSVDGMVLNRPPEGSIKLLKETSVALFNCPLDVNRTELKGTVLFKNHEELLNFSKDEVEEIKQVVNSLNANILVVSGNINEIFLEFANLRNILVLRVFNKFDLKRICDAVGGVIYTRIGAVKAVGWIHEVSQFEDAGCEMTRIVARTTINTIVLKHTLKSVMDEMEKKIQICLAALKKSDDLQFVPDNFHSSLASKIGNKDAVKNRICKALELIEPRKLLLSDGYRCARYALEFISTLLKVDDYLVAKKDILDIRPPQKSGHWDEDH